MLRLVDTLTRTQTGIRFATREISTADVVPYVIYDTSTGASYALGLIEDYYGWRSLTYLTSSGVYFDVNNSDLYPSYLDPLASYSTMKPSLFRVMSYQEYVILQNVLIRLDLVRRRYPNPGFTVDTTNSVGENGVVSFAGGFEKKMTIGEIGLMMEGAIVELNASSPMTSFWPSFMSSTADVFTNPYTAVQGIPYDMVELIVLGTLIRCLIAVGILEVDIHFQASESGLSITFDRATHLKGWHDALLTQYKEMKAQFKWNYANHAGVGVGTVPWAAYGIWGTLLNNVSYGGQLAYTSIMGFGAQGNVPL
ncbi:MAG TPA: hypothetical protein P5136_00365 [Methanofastidiosum sp.]|nr:hypothetical protein [Methanofastidiosum sp.]